MSFGCSLSAFFRSSDTLPSAAAAAFVRLAINGISTSTLARFTVSVSEAARRARRTGRAMVAVPYSMLTCHESCQLVGG